MESRTDLRGQVFRALSQGDGELANKYLYLGPHGAEAWEQVESSRTFRIKEFARDLLRQHLGEILKELFADARGDGLDIVSLGSGTGLDDIAILNQLWGTTQESTALFTVDLSSDLLRRASTNIAHFLAENRARRQRTDVHALCVDIEQLSKMKQYFWDHQLHGRRLFHLLGLTIGNNWEQPFLRSIANSMWNGDYLLIAVDFCLDKTEWETESLESYRQTQHEIMRFLCGPIVTALGVGQNELAEGRLTFHSHIKLSGVEPYDVMRSGIRIVSRKIHGLSDVPEAVSLARYYVDSTLDADRFLPGHPELGGRGRLCDFSNKYSSTAFKEWLNIGFKTNGLCLVCDDLCRWGFRSQHLLLLKKSSEAKPASQDAGGILADLDFVRRKFGSLLGPRAELGNKAKSLQELLRAMGDKILLRRDSAPKLDQDAVIQEYPQGATKTAKAYLDALEGWLPREETP